MNFEVIAIIIYSTLFSWIFIGILAFRYRKHRGAIFGYFGFGLDIIGTIILQVSIASGAPPSDIQYWTTPLSFISAIFIALAFLTLPTSTESSAKGNNSLKSKNQRSLEEFSGYYLVQLKSNLRKFSTFFSVIGFIIFIQLLIEIFTLLIAFRDSVGIAGAVQKTLSFSMLVWLAFLVSNLVKLQSEKVENDIVTTIKHRSESKSMSEKILKKAEERAGHKITITGDNAMLALDGGSISGSSQVKNIQGDTELMKSLALLISYVEESKEPQAIHAANKLAEEATKPEPDKGKIFELWNKVTVITPQVSELVSVVSSIKSLFM